jgi:hypothetical protein
LREPLVLDGMLGLGDNLYQRPVLRELVKARPVYLSTSWPQLYRDLPIRFIKPTTRLRTQSKNLQRWHAWSSLPGIIDRRRWHYTFDHGDTILESLCKGVGLKAPALDMSGPPMKPVHREPYIVVRPATVRTEWRAESRNPRPEYIAQAVDALRGRYRVVSVADLTPGAEWALEPLPHADERFHRGELDIEQLLALVAGAAAVVGGVGWLVPAAIAYRVPMLLLFGGWGMHNRPERIFDPRLDVSRIHCVLPDRHCLCSSAAHACDKTISNLDAHLERFALRLAARESADMVS